MGYQLLIIQMLVLCLCRVYSLKTMKRFSLLDYQQPGEFVTYDYSNLEIDLTNDRRIDSSTGRFTYWRSPMDQLSADYLNSQSNKDMEDWNSIIGRNSLALTKAQEVSKSIADFTLILSSTISLVFILFPSVLIYYPGNINIGSSGCSNDISGSSSTCINIIENEREYEESAAVYWEDLTFEPLAKTTVDVRDK